MREFSGVAVRAGELDVAERGRLERVLVGGDAGHADAAEVVVAVRSIALAGAELRERDVSGLGVGEERPVVTARAFGRRAHERVGAAELLRC